VVSEETGSISVSVDGKIFKDLSTTELREKLEMVFVPEEQKENDETVQEEPTSEDDVASGSDSDLVRD